MEIVFLPDADAELHYWVKTGNKTILKTITQLIVTIQNDPFTGLGKPEPLKHKLLVCGQEESIRTPFGYEVLDERS